MYNKLLVKLILRKINTLKNIKRRLFNYIGKKIHINVETNLLPYKLMVFLIFNFFMAKVYQI